MSHPYSISGSVSVVVIIVLAGCMAPPEDGSLPTPGRGQLGTAISPVVATECEQATITATLPPTVFPHQAPEEWAPPLYASPSVVVLVLECESVSIGNYTAARNVGLCYIYHTNVWPAQNAWAGASYDTLAVLLWLGVDGPPDLVEALDDEFEVKAADVSLDLTESSSQMNLETSCTTSSSSLAVEASTPHDASSNTAPPYVVRMITTFDPLTWWSIKDETFLHEWGPGYSLGGVGTMSARGFEAFEDWPAVAGKILVHWNSGQASSQRWYLNGTGLE